MCTGFVRKGKDVIVGFNLDINLGAMEYEIHAEPDQFYIGVKPDPTQMVPSEPQKTYGKNGVIRIQGVNSQGNFGTCLNNMNFAKAPFSGRRNEISIDWLIDQYIAGDISLQQIMDTANEKKIVNLPKNSVDIPDLSMHSILADRSGKIVILEPGNGYAVINEKYAVLTNFPLLELAADFRDEKSGYYGKDRYDTAMKILRESRDDFNVEDGLSLLQAVKQENTWGTRVSFVYSNNENAVYYCEERNFDHIIRHPFS